MKVLVSNGKLPELKSVKHNYSESCTLGKQRKVSFSKGGRKPKAAKLELVHTDVWGPAPVASLGGSRYYVTFIDDSSRKEWVYFLKNKSYVYDNFKRWRAMVENETNLKVKCLRLTMEENMKMESSRSIVHRTGSRSRKPFLVCLNRMV